MSFWNQNSLSLIHLTVSLELYSPLLPCPTYHLVRNCSQSVIYHIFQLKIPPPQFVLLLIFSTIYSTNPRVHFIYLYHRPSTVLQSSSFSRRYFPFIYFFSLSNPHLLYEERLILKSFLNPKTRGWGIKKNINFKKFFIPKIYRINHYKLQIYKFFFQLFYYL